MAIDEGDIATARRDGQVRLWWDDTPVDVFFEVHDFHAEAAAGVRVVPFADTDIPVLGCTQLAVFKIVFNRTRDWADLEEMLAVDAVDRAALLGWAVRLFGPYDPRVSRLADLVG